MKEAVYENPNKMKFESLSSVFNRQTNLIGVGNVIANTQYSNYIRKGEFQSQDIEHFRKLGVSSAILREVIAIVNSDNESYILYCFRHYTGPVRNPSTVIDGVVLTTGRDEGYLEVKRWYENQHYRAYSAVAEAILYITNGKREEKLRSPRAR